jgi:hypothetical protein
LPFFYKEPICTFKVLITPPYKEVAFALLLFGTFKLPFAFIVAVSSLFSILPKVMPTVLICSAVSEAIVAGASSWCSSFLASVFVSAVP